MEIVYVFAVCLFYEFLYYLLSFNCGYSSKVEEDKVLSELVGREVVEFFACNNYFKVALENVHQNVRVCIGPEEPLAYSLLYPGLELAVVALFFLFALLDDVGVFHKVDKEVLVGPFYHFEMYVVENEDYMEGVVRRFAYLLFRKFAHIAVDEFYALYEKLFLVGELFVYGALGY